MKFGKPHLIGSLALLGASIVYNVWIFTHPSSKEAAGLRGPAPVDALPDRTANRDAAAPIDLMKIAAPADIVADRAPEWPRDPFTSATPPPPAPVAQAPPEPEQDIVVASILHSPERQLAIVNGHIVKVGDSIGGATVVDILPRAVVIESPARGRRTIELRSLDSRKEAARR